ncbi:hypothetical protein ACFQZC_06405 [Streptacidiphilus monticola]
MSGGHYPGSLPEPIERRPRSTLELRQVPAAAEQAGGTGHFVMPTPPRSPTRRSRRPARWPSC